MKSFYVISVSIIGEKHAQEKKDQMPQIVRIIKRIDYGDLK